MRILWGVVAIALVAACDGGAPSCKDAVAKAVKNGAGASEAEQQLVIKTCEDKNWAADVRGCLAKASTKSDARACLKPVMADLDGLKDSLRDRLEAAKGDAENLARQASAAADKARAAADEAIGDAKVAIAQADEVRKQLEAQAPEIEAQIKAVAEATSDDARAKAQAALAVLQTKKSELEMKLAIAKAAVTAAARARGIGGDGGSGSGQ